jgi:hypothetical protein
LLTFCLLWALVVPATAQVYKWVDEKGTIHYGERPPPDKKAQELEQHQANPGLAPGKAEQPSWKDKELEFRSRRIETEQAEAQRKQREDAQRQACNQARDQLGQMKLARRLYHLDDKGERVFQSDDERSASIAHQEQQVAQRCP